LPSSSGAAQACFQPLTAFQQTAWYSTDAFKVCRRHGDGCLTRCLVGCPACATVAVQSNPAATQLHHACLTTCKQRTYTSHLRFRTLCGTWHRARLSSLGSRLKKPRRTRSAALPCARCSR
jgi:hypothetical protein